MFIFGTMISFCRADKNTRRASPLLADKYKHDAPQ